MLDHPSVPFLLVSYPDSGRTWLRHMLFDLGIMPDNTHDGADHTAALPMTSLNPDKSAYRDRRVLLLTRDPRDATVSGWHHCRGRLKRDVGPLSDFIRDPRYGVAKAATFNLQWFNALGDLLPNCAVVSYESLHRDAAAEVALCARFAGIEPMPDQVHAAVAARTFENMQEQERRGELRRKSGKTFKTTDAADVTKFKVRQGKVGSYRLELSNDDIFFCDETLAGLDYEQRSAEALRLFGLRMWWTADQAVTCGLLDDDDWEVQDWL